MDEVKLGQEVSTSDGDGKVVGIRDGSILVKLHSGVFHEGRLDNTVKVKK